MERYFRSLSKIREKLFRLPNVVGVGVGYKEIGGEKTNRASIMIFVEKKVPSRELRREHAVPLKIGDLETDVVETGRFRFLGARTEKARPARPGMSIAHYKVTAGTFGAVVKDKKTTEKLILSNNHILANATDGRDGRSAVGDPVFQPGPHDGGGSKDRIGTLLRFVPVKRAVQEVECPVAVAATRAGNVFLHTFRPRYDLRLTKRNEDYNLVDAAVARPDTPELVDDDILEVGRVEGVAGVHPGDQVIKSGRTSGLSSGKVLSTGITVKVDMSDSEVGWFTDQVMTDAKSKPGDSGSLFLNSKKEAVGLLFAGSDRYTVFNRIQNVMEKLNVIF